MEEVTIKNYQRLAMQTCLPSAKNWEYCYCLIASEIGEAFGKWGKKFRDGEFDKEKLTDELGDSTNINSPLLRGGNGDER